MRICWSFRARLGRGVHRRGAGNRPDARRSLRSRVRGRRRLIREDGLAGRPRARAGQKRHTIAAVGFLDRLRGRTEPDTRDDGDWFTLCAASIQSVVGESGYQPCLDKTVRGATPTPPFPLDKWPRDISQEERLPWFAAYLQREPDNPYDTNAVAVSMPSTEVGYLAGGGRATCWGRCSPSPGADETDQRRPRELRSLVITSTESPGPFGSRLT